MKRLYESILHRGPATDIRVLNERGFVLIVAMLALCLLSLMGIWALSTSDFEFKIASNLQTLESNFNIAEGAAYQEGEGVSFARPVSYPWYQISNPNNLDNPLLPPTTAAFYDPGNDIDWNDVNDANNDSTIDYQDFERGNYESWPHQNLMQNTADDQYDYTYLVTYLYPDNPPPGFDATQFSGYKFRISTHQKVFVEIGGIRVGVRAAGP